MNNLANDADANELDLVDLLKQKSNVLFAQDSERLTHRCGQSFICRTEARAEVRSPARIVVEATEGFIPLWEENMVIKWTFSKASLARFNKPEAIKAETRAILNKAITLWGDAVPIRFVENADNSDFEIVIEQNDDCSPQGCTLAQAFFPDSGRHQLYVFPKMFEQSEKERVDTLAHEIGHVFGLRHFFAPENEVRWPSEIFGQHKPFSIMNYGANSEMTAEDRSDLKLLYESAWSGALKHINGTPIKLVRPFHYLQK